MSTRFIDRSSAGSEASQQGSATASLAAALVRFEAEWSAERPGEIVLTDASDAALAAALAASKLLIPVRATAAAIAGPGTNADLIAQLADAYTPSA